MKKEIIHVNAQVHRDGKRMTAKAVLGILEDVCRAHPAVMMRSNLNHISQNQNQERYDNTNTLGRKEDQRKAAL
jgi:hypothetical protein